MEDARPIFNKTRVQHFIFWKRRSLFTLFFPRLFLKKGWRRDWMSWNQYKAMTNNLSFSLKIHEK